jgi:hypothetical protein
MTPKAAGRETACAGGRTYPARNTRPSANLIVEYIFYLVHGKDIRHTAVDDAVIDIGSERETD